MTCVGQGVTSMGLMAKEKTTQLGELKKHVATIHCSNTLTLLQRKISNALLYHAYQKMLVLEEHDISIKQLCGIIGYNGNNHKKIKDALKGLISTIVEWDVVDSITGEEDWTASTILASVRLKGSQCTYAYSPRMKELLHSPSVYAKINLITQAHFQSSYGLALYENCIRYRGLPHTKWFDMDLFKKLMGVPDSTYPIFRDLKRRVLDKAVEEVNTYSDLLIEYEVKRIAQKVINIRFKLKQREKKKRFGMSLVGEGREVQQLELSTVQVELVHELRKYGLHEEEIKKLLQAYDSEFIFEKIKLVKSSEIYMSGEIRNVAGYLIKSIKNDYKLPKISRELIDIDIKEKEEQMNELRKSMKDQEKLKQNYSEYLNEKVKNFMSQLSEKEIDFIKEEFGSSLGKESNPFVKYYRKSGLENKTIWALFRHFFIEKYRSSLNLFSFDEFSKMELADS